MNVGDILSSRVRGSAHVQFVTKRVRKPATLLTVDEIRHLEHLVLESTETHIQVLAGHFMFCLLAAARWHDSMHIISSEVSSYKGIWIIEADTQKHKTSLTKQLQTELLPFTALGRFLSDDPWVKSFMEARRLEGFQDGPPFLTSWSSTIQGWSSYAMTTAEATAWLRELLVSVSGEERASELTVHGLKATMLSWCAKSMLFSPEELTAMGHHMSQAHKSSMIYSRDNQIALNVKVHNMLVRMKSGTFSPDQPRAARLFDLAAQVEREMDSGGRRDDSSDIDSSDSDADSMADSGDELLPKPREPMGRANASEIDPTRCWVHKLSSVIHVSKVSQEGKLGCGRALSLNFRRSKTDELGVPASLVCAGCSAYLQHEASDL